MRPGKRHPRAAEREASQGRRVCDAARVKPAVMGISGAHCLLLVVPSRLPGADVEVGEDGHTLSGGQRARYGARVDQQHGAW
jgi:ABC-type protease/lipase transport system fused ATPase/permease subunit